MSRNGIQVLLRNNEFCSPLVSVVARTHGYTYTAHSCISVTVFPKKSDFVSFENKSLVQVVLFCSPDYSIRIPFIEKAYCQSVML